MLHKVKSIINPISKLVTHTSTHGIVRGIPKFISDDDINTDLHLIHPQANATRLISKRGPLNIVKVVFSIQGGTRKCNHPLIMARKYISLNL